MMKRIAGVLFLSALLCLQAHAHSGKPKYHVIIDTDGAIDDMRAISMLLACNDVRVLAITCSQGSLLPGAVHSKVRALLTAFHHEGIPVGISGEVDSELPAWSSFAQAVQWGNGEGSPVPDPCTGSAEVLDKALEDYASKVTLIALGSLDTYASWLKANPEAAEKIDRILWYNSHGIRDGFNYTVSPGSYAWIQSCGIQLDVVSGESAQLPVGREYLDHIRETDAVYARQIVKAHSSDPVAEKIRERHLYLMDDMVPLYLAVPVLFNRERSGHTAFVSLQQGLPTAFIYEAIAKLLLSSSLTNNRVFETFPTDTALYKQGYAGMVGETIAAYGPVEWRAIVMTNEIHGHTGIYSIIGAKMGIRAMEYFNVGVNNLEVVSYAGKITPLSCFNDGVQISTGATIGQGLITVSDSVSPIPTATFTFNHREVKMSLKRDIALKIREEVAYGVSNYGLLSDTYWLYIEGLAMKYWKEFDRHELFDYH